MFNYKYFDDLSIELIDGDRGKNYPKNDEMLEKGYCLFLNAKNVTLNGFAFDENVFITKEKDEILRKGKLNRNDIVLTTRGTIGNVGLYDDKITYDNIRINSGMLIIRNNDNNINTKYLYYQLTSPFIRNQIFSLKTGSAQSQIPITVLKKLKLIIPDKRIQDKIVRVMDSIINKLTLNNEINNNLYEIIKNNYDTLLENCDWEEVELGAISNITSGKRPIDKLEIGDYPVIGANGVMAYTSYFNFNEDLIITGRVGTLGIIRRYYEKIWASDNALVIQTKYLNYIENYLKTIDYYSLNRGSTQPLLTQGDLKNQMVRFNEKEISEFEDRNRFFIDKIRNNEKENKYLSQLRDTLLPKLMNGEIDLDNIEI